MPRTHIKSHVWGNASAIPVSERQIQRDSWGRLASQYLGGTQAVTNLAPKYKMKPAG